MAPEISHGVTITFATSAFSAEILEVTPPGSTRKDIQTSHQGTTDSHTFTPADLVDNGTLEFNIHYDPSTAPPMNAAAETITVRFKSGENISFTGYMNGFKPGAAFEDKFTAAVSVKVSGDISHGTGTGSGSGSGSGSGA